MIFDRNEVRNKTTRVARNTASRYTPNFSLGKGRDELTFPAPVVSCLKRQQDYLRVIIHGRHMSPASTKRFVPFRFNTKLKSGGERQLKVSKNSLESELAAN